MSLIKLQYISFYSKQILYEQISASHIKRSLNTPHVSLRQIYIIIIIFIINVVKIFFSLHVIK